MTQSFTICSCLLCCRTATPSAAALYYCLSKEKQTVGTQRASSPLCLSMKQEEGEDFCSLTVGKQASLLCPNPSVPSSQQESHLLCCLLMLLGSSKLLEIDSANGKVGRNSWEYCKCLFYWNRTVSPTQWKQPAPFYIFRLWPKPGAKTTTKQRLCPGAVWCHLPDRAALLYLHCHAVECFTASSSFSTSTAVHT